jgi:hypothetical protein
MDHLVTARRPNRTPTSSTDHEMSRAIATTTKGGTMNSMTSLNPYGQQALDHWRTQRPDELAALENPQQYFQTLGEQVQEAVTTRTEQLVASQPATGFLERFQAEQTARLIAEDEVMRAMVFTEPDHETPNPPTAQTPIDETPIDETAIDETNR